MVTHPASQGEVDDVLDILLVDDNQTDVLLTCLAFEDAAFPYRLHVVSDGVDALAFLRREAPYAGASTPSVVLLDMNMPGMAGHEVLTAMRADPKLRDVFVIMQMSSARDEDVWRARGVRPDAFLPKPVDPAAVLALLQNSKP